MKHPFAHILPCPKCGRYAVTIPHLCPKWYRKGV